MEIINRFCETVFHLPVIGEDETALSSAESCQEMGQFLKQSNWKMQLYMADIFIYSMDKHENCKDVIILKIVAYNMCIKIVN